ncbi:hypothetical protein ACN4EK_08540 [Pantanalinema rosaneae CENA516]|jgi:hypothetical protein|uniref:hypothetical protein n=1 Tax=Leptolyngbyaceae TaxID=1890438 RepID=UPI00094F9FE7|nr:hypothetical protein [Leptolyngbya sp. 'hensonii']OLP15913.1 hypothetical protein BST81_23585 [Leptolyngbya sp. 'hensonii']
MLAIARVKSPRYYIDTAQKQDEFDPTTKGEPPGRWLETAGAVFLGLAGRVKRSDFLSLTQDFSIGEKTLIHPAKEIRRVPGWD